MTPQRLAVLVIAALLATGAAFWLSSARHLERANLEGDLLLPQLRGRLSDVAEVRVSRGDGAQTTLRREADGWVVAERTWRADAGKVRKLLLDLAALAVVEEKTDDPARHATLGVEAVDSPAASGTRIDVKDSSGAIQSLVVGKASGVREVYVRAASAPASFLARPQLSAEANPARWLDTALIDLDPARVRAVLLESPGKRPRTLEAAGLPAGLAAALKGLALEDLQVQPSEPAAKPTPLPPARRARFITWEGLVIEVRGREDGSRRWVTLSAAVDPSAARARRADASGPTAAPAPDPQAESAALSRRVAGREFEIAAYRFASLFDVQSDAAATP